MKKYSVLVVVHIAAICALAILTWILANRQMWFSAAFALAALVFFAIHLYRMQMVQLRIMRRLAKSLHSGDMMINFRTPWRDREMEAMIGELSIAMENFRTRVIERNEIESWQKLIRVLNHEIMNSITPILSLSETLSRLDASEENYADMQQGMQTIHRRSKGLVEFVENYRKLTRIPAPVLKPTSVRELLTHLQQLFPEPYIEIRLPESDLVIMADKAQIEQVLLNLIKNAIEACTNVEEPSITVEVATGMPPYTHSGSHSTSGHGLPEAADSHRCTIAVTDNGCGILPDSLSEVFVPFYTTKPGGSGIGLSLCRQIISRHGGAITASSSPSGTCFTVVI